MADDEERLQTSFGDLRPDNLTTDSAGSGASNTDTGGLDAEGNELGAASRDKAEGRSEGERRKDADQGAQKP